MTYNKKIKLYIILLFCVVLTMFIARFLYLNFRQRDFSEIKETGVIRIATEYNSVGFFVSGDTLSGFQYELSKLLEKRFGIRVETYPVMSLEESMAGLQEGKYDIVARPIPVTIEMRKKFAFTHTVLLNKQVLVQRTNGYGTDHELIRNQISLGKKAIYVTKNSPAILRIRNLSSEIGDTIYIHEEAKYGDEQLVALVARGAIDYAACDAVIARKCQKQYPNIDTKTDISFTQLQAWMVRQKSPQLLDSLNIWLKEIKQSDVFRKVYNKYY